jgi:hypothetical protein
MNMAPQRRHWTKEEIGKLLNMAQRYPAAQIASELGRPINSVRTKAHELALSLRMDPAQVQANEARASSAALIKKMVDEKIELRPDRDKE